MDVDLRQFVALPATAVENVDPKVDQDERREVANSTTKHSSVVVAVDSDLDMSDDDEAAPPFAKKSKSERIDM